MKPPYRKVDRDIGRIDSLTFTEKIEKLGEKKKTKSD